MRTPQLPPELTAGRPARHSLPSKRTLDASEDAEQQNPSPSMHISCMFMSLTSDLRQAFVYWILQCVTTVCCSIGPLPGV